MQQDAEQVDMSSELAPEKERGLSRRQFLARTGALAGLGLAAANLPWSARALAAEPAYSVEGKAAGMRVISPNPTVLETPPEYLASSWITPTNRFFVRNHYETPNIRRKDWELTVDGEAEKSLKLSFSDLRQFEEVTLDAWIQCAGNRRSHYKPEASGGQWDRGGVGNARWRGVRMRDVILRADPKLHAHHVALVGGEIIPDGAPQFTKSIPMEKAMDPNTLLVYEMNGRPLLPDHGFPVRALVPGWVGAASIKWLTHIELRYEPWDGPYQNSSYRVPTVMYEPGATVDKGADFVPAYEMPVNSFFTYPSTDGRVVAGPVYVTGVAYAGETGISKVEVSSDGGRSWKPARFTHEGSAFAWYQWERVWNATPGSHRLMVRATDLRNRTQPVEPIWNPSGYLYNGIDVIDVHVV